MASICNRVGSYLPSLSFKNVERAIMAGIAVQSLCMGGIPMLIAEAGAYYFGRKYLMADELPAQFPLVAGLPTRLDVSARLNVPAETPTKIIWSGNSCFCSSALWSFFASQPVALGELPEAISRRLNTADLFPGGLHPSDEQTAPLCAIVEIVNKREPITLGDFNRLRQSLQQFEVYGFPIGANERNLKALLSLLELHDLIREYQTGKPMKGERINSLREMVFRVDPNFRDTGTRIGDAHEVFQPLANLIFEGSRFEQNLHTTRVGQGQHLTEVRPNWGDIALPMPMPIVSGQKPTLQSIFEEYLAPSKPVKIELGDAHTSYMLKETNQFETAPQFLALTLKRGDVAMVEDTDYKMGESTDFKFKAVQAMNMDEVDVRSRLDLDGRFCRDGRKARYELVSVSRHMGSFAHYDAISRGPKGSWNYCNDLKKEGSVYRFEASDIPKYAETGYMFFFRRVG